ncbi:MAG: hypothetical protein D6703_00015 [Zetaproteobacteria bacterium]|nr:MAG: hypothetical protein D6703_00015 [Zetaproteobacteria bacterium]
MDRKARTTIPLLGALVTGFLASACCIGPLIAVLLGMGSASTFIAMEPYRPLFAILTLALIAWAVWKHWRGKSQCAGCPPKRPVMLWLLAGLALMLLALPNLLAKMAPGPT